MHKSRIVLHSATSWKSLIALASVAALVGGASAQQNEQEREKVDRVPAILEALGSRDGAHIADLGSADGFYTLRIARAVAPTGRAYAIDIDQKALDKLRDRAEKEAVGNIQVILGEAADPKLPEATLDAVLIRNAYHEMPEYRSVLKGVMSGLKPGGLLIVSESMHAKYLSLSRELQVKEHEIAPGIVEAELREAGFEIVERDDSFSTFTRDATGGFWLIKARRSLAK
jgi:ubiquinone/menaquinone biosynthesis C-methylase UbiE